MHQVTEVWFGTLAWCAIFSSPALFGALVHVYDCKRCHGSWRRLDLVNREPPSRTGALPHRRASTPVAGRHYVTRLDMPNEARNTALLLALFGALALPGSLLGLLGLFAWGTGLTAIPVVLVAIGAFAMARALMRADPRFLERALKLQNQMRFAAGWSALVVGVWALLVPQSIVLFAPVLVAAALALHISTRIGPSARQLRATLIARVS